MASLTTLEHLMKHSNLNLLKYVSSRSELGMHGPGHMADKPKRKLYKKRIFWEHWKNSMSHENKGIIIRV